VNLEQSVSLPIDMAQLRIGTRSRGAAIRTFLVAFVTVLLASLPAHAEVPADVSANLAALQPAFQAMVERHQTARTYPSLENADDAKVLKQLWDRPAVLGAPPYTRASIAAALEILKIQNAVLRSFRMHAEHDNAGQRSGAPNEDIIVSAHVMIVHSTAVVAQSVRAYVEATPEDTLTEQQRAGLKTMRIGFTSLHTQLLAGLHLYQFTPPNVDRLTAALAETAPHIFPLTPQVQRPGLEHALTQSRSKVDAAAAARLDAMLVAIKSAPCSQICAFK
jgi:hypothetical protein